MGKSNKDGHDSRELRSAKKRAEKLGLSCSALTIAICGDEKTAKCASAREMHESWKHLRELAKGQRKQAADRISILRIECPGVCRFGPIVGVFPSGTWYGGCDPATLDRIVEHHLKNPTPGKLISDDSLSVHRLTEPVQK